MISCRRGAKTNSHIFDIHSFVTDHRNALFPLSNTVHMRFNHIIYYHYYYFTVFCYLVISSVLNVTGFHFIISFLLRTSAQYSTFLLMLPPSRGGGITLSGRSSVRLSEIVISASSRERAVECLSDLHGISIVTGG